MIPDINLMPKLEKGESSSKLAYLLIGILTVLTVGVLIWMFFNAKGDLETATAQRDSLVVTRDSLQAEITSLETANQGSLEESVAFVERVSYPVSPIIDESRSQLPQNTYLRAYEFSETGVKLTVDFETLNSVSAYVSNLESSPFFDDVQVGTVSNFELDPASEESTDAELFTELPRYTVELNLLINRAHVAAGGGNE